MLLRRECPREELCCLTNRSCVVRHRIDSRNAPQTVSNWLRLWVLRQLSANEVLDLSPDAQKILRDAGRGVEKKDTWCMRFKIRNARGGEQGQRRCPDEESREVRQ